MNEPIDPTATPDGLSNIERSALLTFRLHTLMSAATRDEAAEDVIREALDPLWYQHTPAEQKLLSFWSEYLYGDEIARANVKRQQAEAIREAEVRVRSEAMAAFKGVESRILQALDDVPIPESWRGKLCGRFAELALPVLSRGIVRPGRPVTP